MMEAFGGEPGDRKESIPAVMHQQADAKRGRGTMSEPMHRKQAIARSARISACGQYRWTLTRKWGNGKSICWVMLNPSRADHRRDDPTIRRAMQFTRTWGYDGFTVVNLYPFRSPHPAACRRWAGTQTVQRALRRNAKIVARETKNATLVVAAWGVSAWDSEWIEFVVAAISANDNSAQGIYCLGTTKDGYPKHPLARGKHRIADDQRPVLWRGHGL
jgi:hypothetical protein